MKESEGYKRVLSRGVVALLVAGVLSHWAVSTVVLRELAQTHSIRVKALLGHEEWLDERGAFATPTRERSTWGILLFLLVAVKLTTAARLGTSDFQADVICTLLGTLLGTLLAFASHTLTYHAEMVLRREILTVGVFHSTVGLLGGLLLGALAKLLARLHSV